MKVAFMQAESEEGPQGRLHRAPRSAADLLAVSKEERFNVFRGQCCNTLRGGVRAK